jgi:hypothetical protein
MKNLAYAFVIVFGIIALIGIVAGNLSRTYQPPVATTPAQQKEGQLRRIAAGMIESDLLRAGLDVQVSVLQDDDSKLVIYGKSVNRPFAYNLMARRDFKKLLRDSKFTEVTFMDSMSSPDFVQAYRVK